MITIKDKVCTQTMSDVLSYFYKSDMFEGDNYPSEQEADEAFETFISAAILEDGWYHLTAHDKTLLEDEYPTMFNTYQNPNQLYGAMNGLVKLVAEYRYDKDWQRKSDDLTKQSKDRRRPAKEGKTYREKQFQKDIKRILDYIGHIDMSSDTKGKEGVRSRLRHELRKAQQHPSDYIVSRNKITLQVTKEPIREYLHRLNLSGKYNVIEDFIKEIK